MPGDSGQLFDGGRFTFDLTSHVLLADGVEVKLSKRAAAILAHLINNRHRWVSRKELKGRFWDRPYIEDNSIDRQLSVIRRALPADQHGMPCIETRYKEGWKFVAESVCSNEASLRSPLGTTELERHLPVNRSASGSEVRVAKYSPADTGQFVRIALIVIVSLTCGVAFALWVTPKREVRVINSTQLTNDGNEKSGPLLSDGQQIFFTERLGGRWQIVGIPVSGGEASSLKIPLTNASLQDISRDGSTLLAQSYEGEVSKLWAYTISKRILRPLGTGFYHAAWASHGRTLAAETADELSILISSGSGQRKIDLPGPPPWGVKWSPDGTKLRLSLLDPKRESSAIWELDNGGTRLHRLVWANAGNKFVETGVWNPDGKYFFYSAGAYWHMDIWVLRESAGLFRFGAGKPLRLTSGEPGSWRWPFPSGESTIFALNQFARSELVRFNKSTSKWEPEWGGAAAYELDYSRDGNWVTYTHVPDHTIWKARPNGNARLRLTEAGVEAHQPHWSPDGAQIAYMGKDKKGKWRIFQVSANGGTARELLPSGEEQGVPAWSPDGRYLLFGDLLGRKPKAEMSIHLLNRSTRTVEELACSKGLWSPRWSPNGRYIAAITSDSEAIRVLPWKDTQWSETVKMKFVNNATWSLDSHYLYFDGSDEAFRLRLFRVAVPGGRLERLADITDFPSASENWFGVAPDGTPLAFRGVTTQEIFALKCALP